MFVSVWQLLTAIFFLSALTKLIYKLIKEDRPTKRIVDVRAQQQQQLEEHQEREQELEQRQQPELADDLSPPPSPPVVLRGHHQEGDELDEDDEFEETLSWVFQSASERAQAEEQRRALRFSRQQFRRQLNRLNATAAGVEEQDEQSNQQHSPTSSGEFFDATEFSLSAGNQQQNAAQQQTQSQLEQTSSPIANFQCKQIKRNLGGQQNAGDSLELKCASRTDRTELQLDASAKELKGNRRVLGDDQFNSASQQAVQLTKLIGESFLLEPLRLTCAVLSHTFRTFCAVLDFIEGIETPSGQTTGRVYSGPEVVANRWLRDRQQQQKGRVGISSPAARAQAGQATESSGQSEQPKAGERRRSNYFHRRYLSRRSLSAALLNDSDRDCGPGEELNHREEVPI